MWHSGGEVPEYYVVAGGKAQAGGRGDCINGSNGSMVDHGCVQNEHDSNGKKIT